MKPEVSFNQLNSIEGQLAKLRSEHARAKSDPRHMAKAEELKRKIAQLEKAKYNLFKK